MGEDVRDELRIKLVHFPDLQAKQHKNQQQLHSSPGYLWSEVHFHLFATKMLVFLFFIWKMLFSPFWFYAQFSLPWLKSRRNTLRKNESNKFEAEICIAQVAVSKLAYANIIYSLLPTGRRMAYEVGLKTKRIEI